MVLAVSYKLMSDVFHDSFSRSDNWATLIAFKRRTQTAGATCWSRTTSWATWSSLSSCKRLAITVRALPPKSQSSRQPVWRRAGLSMPIRQLLQLTVLRTKVSTTRVRHSLMCPQAQSRSGWLEFLTAVSTTWRFAQVTSTTAHWAPWKEVRTTSSAKSITWSSKSLTMLRCKWHIRSVRKIRLRSQRTSSKLRVRQIRVRHRTWTRVTLTTSSLAATRMVRCQLEQASTTWTEVVQWLSYQQARRVSHSRQARAAQRTWPQTWTLRVCSNAAITRYTTRRTSLLAVFLTVQTTRDSQLLGQRTRLMAVWVLKAQ